jgi:hypothetical protein
MRGVAKKKITKLGCEKHFFEDDKVSTSGNALWSYPFFLQANYPFDLS